MSVFLQLTVAITGAVLIPDHVGLLFTSKMNDNVVILPFITLCHRNYVTYV